MRGRRISAGGLMALGFLVACVVVVLAVLVVSKAGGVSANWIGEERETEKASCSAMQQACGSFCLFRSCTLCSTCSCVVGTESYCCGTICVTPDPSGPGVCSCNATCWRDIWGTCSDCGDTCIRWKWELYEGSGQPGRADGDVDNPFFTDGLGTAFFVSGQPFEGTRCSEEGVGSEQRTASGRNFAPDWTMVVAGLETDEVMELPSGVSFAEEDYEPGPDALSFGGVEESKGVEGSFELEVSGEPSGRDLLVRYWVAGAGEIPGTGAVPFESWSRGTRLDMPRGWHAVQVAYVGDGGDPAGLSEVRVVWSGAASSVSTVREPRGAEKTSLPEVGEGVVRPDRPDLGLPYLDSSQPGRVLFTVSARPVGTRLQYRLWEATGQAPVAGQAGWTTVVPAGNVLSLLNRGVLASGAGYMAVETRLLKYEAGFGDVESPSSVTRYYWVEPDQGDWVATPGVVGEFVWRPPARSLFRPPEMTPVPSVGSAVGTPTVGAVRRLTTATGYVRVGVGGLENGTSLEYRIWESSGRRPVGSESEWMPVVPVDTGSGSEAVVWMGSRERGGLGQWMSLHFRQVKDGGSGEMVSEPSSVLDLKLPALVSP